ncbi:MAG TPA: hypothetical protein GXX75_09440 [Clostridiales bacterium]|nr:hypothetical protein [Clostridiales bacterium]
MKKTWMWIIRFFAIIGIIVTGSIILPQQTAYAASVPGPVSVVSVEYYEEQIVVLNNNNKKICFATETDAARDNWEVIDADSGFFTTIDMSWLSPSTENVIVVKGYEDATDAKARVTFDARPTKFSVSINYSNLDTLLAADPEQNIAPLVNIMTSAGTGNNPIEFSDLEWRKGATGQWKKADDLTVNLIEKYQVKGADLYFRIRAVDDVVDVIYGGNKVDFDDRRIDGEGGIVSYFKENSITDLIGVLGTNYPNGTKGRRFSNEAKVKVAKKPPATGYGIDGSRFTADIKYGKEYRVTLGTGESSKWVQVIDRAVKNISLSDIVKSTGVSAIPDGMISRFPAMKIEVRNYATSKSAASKITETSINLQRTIDDDDIKVSYLGTKNLVLEIPTASPTLPYEYTITKQKLAVGEKVDLAKAVWSPVTKGTAIKIPSTKAVDGGTLVVRQKEIKAKKATASSAAVSYELASTYVTKDIKYPSVPEIVDATYTFIKGYTSSDISFTVTLNALDKEPFEKEVKSIKLGNREILFGQVYTDAAIDTIDVTLKATDLSTLANCVAKPLTITYKNGTVDKTSIKLTIQTPSPASSLVVTHKVGTNKGTKFEIVTPKAAGNEWKYVITDAQITGVTNQDMIADKAVGATVVPVPDAIVDDIEITTGKYLTVFEVTSFGNIMKYKSVQIEAKYIK